MDDIFRSFFGFNRRDPPRHGPARDDTEDLYDDELPTQDGGNGFNYQSPDGAFTFSFHFPEPDQMFRHFEEMFRNMGLSEFPPHQPGQPALPSPHQPASPRDEMLKQPDTPQQPPAHQHPFSFGQLWDTPTWGRSRPQERRDADLDEEVQKKGLDSFLSESPQDPPSVVAPQQPSFNFGYKSVTTRITRGADGSIEEHTTMRDGSGAEETTVRRVKDGQEHTVTTRTDPVGRQERQEDLVNMDEKDLDKFEETWRNPSQSNTWNPRNDLVLGEENVDSQTRSIFKNIFGFSFPSFRKT